MLIVRNVWGRARSLAILGALSDAQNATEKGQSLKTVPTATEKVRRNANHAAGQEKRDNSVNF
jgi:hypothetical protein